MPDQTRHTNRLAGETSPYLLQHAHNPVDWYPWGDEAFAEARRRNVPVFLSIGYATCYWCHVMERESFENEAVAAAMNDGFVCVKVDREERPDVDDLYMAATQTLSGRGGWPMTCFLEPEGRRPFWAGTYFPPEPRMGMPGLPQVLRAISDAWSGKRDDLLEQAREVAGHVAAHLAAVGAPVAVGLGQVGEAARTLLGMLDRVHGGFGAAPKFPQPVFLELLLDVRENAGDEATTQAVDQAVRLTLDRMACGGIHDHVGGGFHRYSVDERWLVPHFEKMLYDNAQLAALYARAARVYGDEFYARTARDTVEYVLREMTLHSEAAAAEASLGGEPVMGGPFFSAQDAEVGGHEGVNYLWTPEQVREALGGDGEFAIKVYGLDKGPNFRDPHHPDDPPANVLRLADRPENLAKAMGMEPSAFLARLDSVNRKLYSVRAARPQPRLDDKVLTSWNGLMIAGMARAGTALGEPRYIHAAGRAADFVLGGMRDEGGELLRTCRAGQAKIPGFLEDYAFFIDGLLALHAAEGGSGTGMRLDQARTLADQASMLFGDPVHGGYFDTRAGQSDLFVRARSTHDGAIPSGSSAMLHALIELYERTAAQNYLDQAVACVASVSAAIARSPISAANATRAVLRLIASGEAIAQRLGALGPEPAAGDIEDAAGEGFTPVEIYAATDRIQVGTGTPAELQLVLKIADGYHINAADPGPGGAGLMPLRVGVINGSGITVYADYPKGEPYGPGGELLVHRGQLELTVAVERSGEWSGRPILALTYQACTDSECLAPTTAELDVAVDRAD